MQEIKSSKDIRSLMRFIGEDERQNISEFFNTCLNRGYVEFDNSELALMSIDNGVKYSDELRDVFSNYSGFNYRRINAAARGSWNYEEHGHIDEKARFDEMAKELRHVIDDNQNSIGNVKVFRGVPLSYFSSYDVSSLEDLNGLKGGFLLDRGFVSTSLVDDASYYKKENELGLNYNVKIEYLVPEEFKDGVSISSVSYSPMQCEYLVNAWNLAKVVDVRMDGDDGAIVQAMLVPKYVYDKAYQQDTGLIK